MQAEVDSAPAGRVSEAEYLAFEAASPVKHEFVLGWVRAMAGASRQHNRVTRQVDRLLSDAAARIGCEVFGSDMRLRVSHDIYYYPELSVVCDPDGSDDWNVTRPCVVVEVVSPSTVAVDRGEKLLAYRGIESLQTYLIVWPDERRVEHHWRDDDHAWHSADLLDEGTITIPCLNTELTLDAIYAGVDSGASSNG